jgi:hypothetical protein
MIDIWFIAGMALGTIVTGFCAIGSFDRGSDSVHRRSWTREHVARNRALMATRATIRKMDEDDLRRSLNKAI